MKFIGNTQQFIRLPELDLPALSELNFAFRLYRLMAPLQFTEWAAARSITIRYIHSQASQNAFIERFNRTYRTEVLDAYLFTNLEQIQTITDQWLVDYNEYRPYEMLGNIPPAQFMPRLTRVPNLYLILPT
jgi:putative transposase